MRKKRTDRAARKFFDDSGGPYWRFLLCGFFLFVAYLFIARQSHFMPTFVTAVIGGISSIFYFSHWLPVPFEAYKRYLEPFELKEEERKVLSYLKGGAGKKNVIHGAVGISFIIVLFGLIAPKKPVDSPDMAGTCFYMPQVLIVFWLTARLGIEALNILGACKNWRLIQMTFEPWPLDKPYRTPLFSFKKKRKLSVEEYRKLMMKAAEYDELVKSFLETTPFENIRLFLDKDRYSAKDLKMISELDRPWEYFAFFDRLAKRAKEFKNFSTETMLKAFTAPAEDFLSNYDSYLRLLVKADENLLDELMLDWRITIFLDDPEFVLGELEKDPSWKEKAERTCALLSSSDLAELIDELPDTRFGREYKNAVEIYLSKGKIIKAGP